MVQKNVIDMKVCSMLFAIDEYKTVNPVIIPEILRKMDLIKDSMERLKKYEGSSFSMEIIDGKVSILQIYGDNVILDYDLYLGMMEIIEPYVIRFQDKSIYQLIEKKYSRKSIELYRMNCLGEIYEDKQMAFYYSLYIELITAYLNRKYNLYQYENYIYESDIPYVIDYITENRLSFMDFDFMYIDNDFYIENLSGNELDTLVKLVNNINTIDLQLLEEFINSTLLRVLNRNIIRPKQLELGIIYIMPDGDLSTSPNEIERRAELAALAHRIEEDLVDLNIKCFVNRRRTYLLR